MTAAYRMDPTRSRFTVHAYATGLLSFMGHNPTFLVRDFGGEVVFEGGKVGGMRLALTVRAESLALADSARPADRLEIEDTTRRSVLAVAAHPVIRYRADEVAAETLSPGHHRLRLNGSLALHGVIRRHPVDADLTVFDDGIRVRGGSRLRLSDYAIRPVTALAGAVKLKDELELAFDIAAVPEGP